MEEASINGIPLSSLGITMVSGWRAELMTPAPIKGLVTNDDPTKPGMQVITELSDGKSAAVIKNRDVTLTFLLEGDDEQDFIEKYSAFVDILYHGGVTLHVPALGQYFRLTYSNTTKYNDHGTACSLAIKFNEPNPLDRNETSLY